MDASWYKEQAKLCRRIAEEGYGRNHPGVNYRQLAAEELHTLGCTVRLDPQEIRMYHLFLSFVLQEIHDELSS